MTRDFERSYLGLLILDALELIVDDPETTPDALELLHRAKFIVEEDGGDEYLDIYNDGLENLHQVIVSNDYTLHDLVEAYQEVYSGEDYYSSYLQIWNEILDGKPLAFPFKWAVDDLLTYLDDFNPGDN